MKKEHGEWVCETERCITPHSPSVVCDTQRNSLGKLKSAVVAMRPNYFQ